MGSTAGSNNSANCMSIKEVNVGSYQFKVNYAQALIDRLVQLSSPKFTFGGHDWSLYFFPRVPNPDRALILLRLLSKFECTATFELCLLNKNGTPSLMAFKRASHTFSNLVLPPSSPCLQVLRDNFEQEYLIDGCLFVLCTIFLPHELTTGRPSAKHQFHLHEDLGNLLNRHEIADTTFEVEGEIFHAHKTILAARSPVFKAQLFGWTAEAKSDCLKIVDMQAIVFKGLLSYMYTDSFEEDSLVVIQHILVAADRYALDGLRVMCEEKLSMNVSLDTVLSFLALAEQHNFKRLKDACLDFAVKPENYFELSLMNEYMQLMQDCTSLFSELRERACRTGAFKATKRQRS